MSFNVSNVNTGSLSTQHTTNTRANGKVSEGRNQNQDATYQQELDQINKLQGNKVK